jgi:hypothetical protein
MMRLRIPAIVMATVIAGVLLDTRMPRFGQAVADVVAWSVLVWIWRDAPPAQRRRMVLCVMVGSVGELILLDGWGVYRYRAGHLPLFVPAGHALAYAAADDLAEILPARMPRFLVAGLAVYVAWAAIVDVDRQAVIWWVVLAALVAFGRARRLYAALFLMASAIEAIGTALGSWVYFPRDHLFGLTTTNPPVLAGGIYALSIAIVLVADRGVTALGSAAGRARVPSPDRS